MEAEQVVGDHLRRWRLLLDLPQELVAERAGVSRATLARLEHGDGARLGSVLAVARALGIQDHVLAGFDPLRTDLGQARVRHLGRRRARSQ
ncbi:helix-turn-helix domain-containing protein [Citricoccus zhacaiensis]